MNPVTNPLTRLSLLLRMKDANDVALLDQARAEFFATYQPLVERWCRRCGLSPEDAHDVAVDVILKLFESVKTFRPERGTPFRGWLKVIVERAAIDAWRKAQRRPRLLTDAQLAALRSEESVGALCDELSRIGREDDDLAQEIVRRARARVKPHTWDAFYRHKILGEPAKEVGAALGISDNSVFVAANRVAEILREERTKLLEEST